MFGAATELGVTIHPIQDVYTNGDEITGFITLRTPTTSSSVTVQAVLKCTECIEFDVEIDDIMRTIRGSQELYEQPQGVFPSSAAEITASSKKIKAPLDRGEHRFYFRFQLPSVKDRLPPTLRVDCKSKVSWGISAKLEAPPSMVANDGILWARKEFEFQSSAPSILVHLRPKTTKLSKEIAVYLPGFAEWNQQISSKLVGLVPKFSRFRLKTKVELNHLVPKDSLIPQGSNQPIGNGFRVTLGDPELAKLLCITSIECKLVQRIVLQKALQVKKNLGVDVSKRRIDSESVLLQRKQLQWNLKDDLAKIDAALSGVRLMVPWLPSRNGGLINVCHDLVLTVGIASVEIPKRVEKLCISTPVYIQQRLVERVKKNGTDTDNPPAYAVHHLSPKCADV